MLILLKLIHHEFSKLNILSYCKVLVCLFNKMHIKLSKNVLVCLFNKIHIKLLKSADSARTELTMYLNSQCAKTEFIIDLKN